MESVEICAICLATRNDPVKPRNCRHIFCQDCLEQWSREHDSCPVCRQSYEYIECDFDQESGEFEKLRVVKRIICQFNEDLNQLRGQLFQRQRRISTANITRWREYLFQRYGPTFGSQSPSVVHQRRFITSPPTRREIESSRINALNRRAARNQNRSTRIVRSNQSENDPRTQIEVTVEGLSQ